SQHTRLRNTIRNSGVPNLALGSHQSLRQCWQWYQEGTGNLSGGEATERMQGEGDLRLQCQRGMTAGEHELEPFVRDGGIFHILCSSLFLSLLLLKQRLNHDLFARKRVLTAQAVNGLVPGGRSDPGTRIMRNTIDTPAFKGHQQRILQGILGQLEISHRANQGGKDAASFS